MNRGEGDRICIESFPPEVLIHILSFLPATQFIRCRLVCSRWLLVIDASKKCQALWQRYAGADFKDLYENARKKSYKEMSWYKTYRSLRSWSMIAKAAEDKRDFYPGHSEKKQILGFQLLNHGVIGLHTKTSIDYYNLETMEKCDESIYGQYVNYEEDEHYLVVLNNRNDMFVTRKEIIAPNDRTEVPNVRRFVLKDHKVYYTVSAYHKEFVHLIDLLRTTMHKEYITKIYDPIMSIGFVKGDFYYVNTRAYIFRLEGKRFNLIYCLKKYDNILHELRSYDLVDRLEWRIYYFWLLNYNMRITTGVLCGITYMRTYGDVYLVGCKWGFMRIYYAPYKQDLLEIFTSRPAKQFKLVEREYNRPCLSMCPVEQIDVMEIPEGHNVVVALPMKIVQIRFTNNFKAVIDPATCGRRRNRQHFWEVKPTPLKASSR